MFFKLWFEILEEPNLIFKSRAYSTDFVRLNMAINNLIHDLPADVNDLSYADSNLTLFQHELFETNNEWAVVRNHETVN